MQKFNYTPSNPFSGSVSSLAIGAGMVVVPLVYPFGIRIGRMRILGPTAVTIIFVIGGLALLAFTVREIMQARKLIAQGGEITVEGGKVTIPVVRKKRGRQRVVPAFGGGIHQIRRGGKRIQNFAARRPSRHPRRVFRKRGGVRRVQVHFRQIALPAGNSGRSANTTYGNLRR
ncbi:hypothetical protein [Alistipes finegoldii]